MNESQLRGFRRFFKYCISGGIGAGIDFSLFSILVIIFHAGYLLSNCISFSIGTIIVCYLQKNWTFQHQSRGSITLYSKYIVSIGAIFLLNNVLLVFFIECLCLGDISAKFLQIIISPIIGYWIQRSFVFTNSCE